MLSNGKVVKTMTDKKLTDNEIIKALECCIKCNSDCEKCEIYDFCEEHNNEMNKATLDLINRQKAKIVAEQNYSDCLNTEIDRLKPFEDKIAEFKSHIRVEDMLVFANSLEEWLEFCDNLKAEAYKEFADRLKICLQGDIRYDYKILFECDIDNLLKEIIGE